MTLYTWHYDNIPSSWKPILERLKKFETLAQKISKGKKRAENRFIRNA